MTLSVLQNTQVPTYHKWMYLQGYTPEQIINAFRSSKQQPEEEVYEIRITSEVNYK